MMFYDTTGNSSVPTEHRGETIALKILRRGDIFGLEDALNDLPS
jgi:hypothetical protein